MRRLLLLAAFALALVGCGGASSDSDRDGRGSSEPRTEPTAASSSPSSEPDSATTAPSAAVAPAPASAAAPELAPSEPLAPEPAAVGVTVWVTRNAGAELLHAEQVRSGLTAVQTVALAADVETRYGGRYVSGIDGISSDLTGQEDWFFLINGIEPDVGGAEVKVDDGDVVWWDHRSWVESAAHPAAVIGAFPHPFHRGWRGVVRSVEVVAPEALAELSSDLEAFLGSHEPDDPAAEPHRFVLDLRADQEGAELSASVGTKNGSPVTFVLAGNETALRATVAALIASPEIVARKYSARFDDEGQVVDS